MAEVIQPVLPNLSAVPLHKLVGLLAQTKTRRAYIATVDSKASAIEAHIMLEIKTKMIAEDTKTVKITDVGSVTLVDTARMKTTDPMKFMEWWESKKLQPLLAAGESPIGALNWFKKDPDTEMIKLELEETGFLPDGIDQTIVTTMRFTAAKPPKE